MKPETTGNNMMLLTTSFRAQKSFNLIPVTLDCPYVEAMYDPETKILACISKVHKQSYHMVPKLDDNGDPQRLKIGKREGGKTVREQRVLVDTFSEFYINEEKEIIDFIKVFACNEKKFDYTQYFKGPIAEEGKEVSSIAGLKLPNGIKANVKNIGPKKVESINTV